MKFNSVNDSKLQILACSKDDLELKYILIMWTSVENHHMPKMSSSDDREELKKQQSHKSESIKC